MDVEQLLRAEQIDPGEVESLVEWARRRAADLVRELADGDDPQQLLRLLEAGSVTEGSSLEFDPAVFAGRDGPGPATLRSDGDHTVPVTVGPADASDDDRVPLELDGVTEDEPAANGPLAGTALESGRLEAVPSEVLDEPSEEILELDDEIELIEDDELELVEDDDAGDEPSNAARPPAPPPAPRDDERYGPPDGSDDMPAWKAALMSASGEDAKPSPDRESSEGHTTTEESVSTRLEAEEDEISKHRIDLSDLDAEL